MRAYNESSVVKEDIFFLPTRFNRKSLALGVIRKRDGDILQYSCDDCISAIILSALDWTYIYCAYIMYVHVYIEMHTISIKYTVYIIPHTFFRTLLFRKHYHISPSTFAVDDILMINRRRAPRHSRRCDLKSKTLILQINLISLAHTHTHVRTHIKLLIRSLCARVNGNKGVRVSSIIREERFHLKRLWLGRNGARRRARA